MENIGFIHKDLIYLFNRGELFHSYRKFGAHLTEHKGMIGTHFAVWVPGVAQVYVTGDFSDWVSERNPMFQVGDTGVWVLFIQENLLGKLYKYEIHTFDGEVFLKSDPFAFYSELRPATASIVYSLEGYQWRDQNWMEKRRCLNPKEHPMSIYEVHLGSWRRNQDGSFYNWQKFAAEIIDYVKNSGYSHLELMPVMEHPFDGSWGYQLTGYYSCTSRFGSPHDFMYFVDQCHHAGIGVILDWVPGHFCKDAHGLGRFNGQAVYEKEENGEWGTYNFDLSKTEVWSFLISNAVFWFETYHIDGLRVDGVSSMLYLDYGRHGDAWKPNIKGGRENLEAIAFMQRLNQVVFEYFSGILMIAEESTDWPLVSYPTYLKGLGYNFKWNMGWMNDTLRYMQLDFPLRTCHHHLLTFSLTYAFSENFVLPFSHDEVVHGKQALLDKMPGDYWQKFAGLRILFAYLICHPGKKLMFMGGELAQFIEWRYDAELDWLLLDYEMHKKFHEYVKALNRFYLENKALWEIDHDWSGFEWIDVNNDKQSLLVFCRYAKNKRDYLVMVFNFQPNSYEDFRIGIPRAGRYREVFNSDYEIFGGSGIVRDKAFSSEKVSWHGKPFSIRIKVPPLAAVILKAHTKYTLARGMRNVHK